MKLEGISHVSQDSISNSSTPQAFVNTSLLVRLNHEMFPKLYPVFAYLLLLLVLGVTGNIMVWYIFYRKMSQNFQNRLLMWLGVCDLLAIGIGVPGEMYDIRHYYLFPSAVVCKTLRSLTVFSSMSSIFVLVVIAVDRYMKVCHPLHHQFHLHHIRIVIIIIFLASIVFSVPAVLVYGHRTFSTEIPGIFGHDCSVSDEFKNGIFPLLYESIIAAAFGLVSSLLIFIYVRIWFEIRRHRRYLMSHSMMGVINMADMLPSEMSSSELRHHSVKRHDSQVTIRSRLSSLLIRRSTRAAKRKNRKNRKPPRKKTPAEEENADLSSKPEEHLELNPTKPDNDDGGESDDGGNAVGCYYRVEKPPDHHHHHHHVALVNPRGKHGEGEDFIPFNFKDDDVISLDDPDLTEEFVLDRDNDTNTMVALDSGQEEGEEGEESQSAAGIELLSPRIIFKNSIPNGIEEENDDDDDDDEVFVKEEEDNDDDDDDALRRRMMSASLREKNDDIDEENRSTAYCDLDSDNNQREGSSGLVRGGDRNGPQRDNISSKSQSNESIETIHADTGNQNCSYSKEGVEGGGGYERNNHTVKIIDQSEKSTSMTQSTTYNTYSRSVQSKDAKEARKVQKGYSAKKTTMIASFITIGFIVSYLPNIVLVICLATSVNFDHNLSDVSLIFYNVLIRSYFANNVMNVFVYGTMNKTFHAHAINLVCFWRKSGSANIT